jgi:hypothetical protein
MGSPFPLTNLSASLAQQNINDVSLIREHIRNQVIPKITHSLNDTMLLNTSLNSTHYIKKDLDGKLSGVVHHQGIAQSNLTKTRYNYMQKTNAISVYRFWINVIVGAIFVACCAFVLLGANKMSAWLNYSIIGFITFVYVIIVLLALRNNSSRRNDDWNKFYFGPYQPNVDE